MNRKRSLPKPQWHFMGIQDIVMVFQHFTMNLRMGIERIKES